MNEIVGKGKKNKIERNSTNTSSKENQLKETNRKSSVGKIRPAITYYVRLK